MPVQTVSLQTMSCSWLFRQPGCLLRPLVQPLVQPLVRPGRARQ